MSHKDYKVRIDAIELVQKALYRNEVFEKDLFNFEVKTQALGDSEKSIVIVIIVVEITKFNESKDLVAEFTIAVIFKVENFKEVFDKDENNLFIIPLEFENLVKTISISTMRGIIFSELRGTQMHKVILPIIMTDSLKPVDGNLIEKVMTKK